MRPLFASIDTLEWIFDLPEHIVYRIFKFLSTRDLLQTTCINRHWQTVSPMYWTEVNLLHRTPDNVKAKIIARSCASLESIHFMFYFDYLLAFGALRQCSRLKHLTIGEGGLVWIAGANVANSNDSSLAARATPTVNIADALDIPTAYPPPAADAAAAPAPAADQPPRGVPEGGVVQDADAKLLHAKAVSAANMAADAANEANKAANATLNAAHLANSILATATASLSNLPPSAITPALQSVLTAIASAVQSASEAASAAATAANAAASAANAGNIAAGMAGHVIRHTDPTAHNSTSSGNVNSQAIRRDRSAKRIKSSSTGFSAKQIKTLRVTTGRSDKKVIAFYKHLFMFTNLRELALDGSISPPHLESVILAARQLHTLRINCSDSGNELQALRHAASLQTLTLEYFDPRFVGALCLVPSLTSLNLHYAGQYNELGLHELTAGLAGLRSLGLSYFKVLPPAPTVNDSELVHLCSLPKLEELSLQIPNVEAGILAQIPLTSLRKLTTSTWLPVSFVQQQPNLEHVTLHISTPPATGSYSFPQEFAHSVPQIKSLDLINIVLSDPVVEILAQMQLRRLKVWCEEVEVPAMETLLRNKTLEFLDVIVTIMGDVTNERVKKMPKANPYLTVNILEGYFKR